jgi:hypothetical protein
VGFPSLSDKPPDKGEKTPDSRFSYRAKGAQEGFAGSYNSSERRKKKMIIITVPRQRYEEFLRHPIWGVAEIQAGKSYQLLLPPYLGWEERARAEEAFARLLDEVKAAKRKRRQK